MRIGFGWQGKTAWPAEELPRLEMPLMNEWIHAGIVQPRLAQGRVEWKAKWQPQRVFGTTRSRITSAGKRCSEQISLAGGGKNFNFSYKQENEKQMYSLSVDFYRCFQIQWKNLDPQSPWTIELIQKPKEPIVLKVSLPDSQRIWAASSLWHLAFEEPGTAEKYIIPLFSPFLPSVSLFSQRELLEQEMLSLARLPRSPDQSRWEALVAQLADDQYTRRQAADCALRQQGPAIVPFLRSLDWNRLDAEQRFRIRRILQELEPPEGLDSLTKVAHWLINDPEIWWILLDRPDLQTRQIAAQRLAQLLGESIPFDPEAPPELRQAQRQRLETKLRPAHRTPREKP
ncbi:MAG: hypothetical protein NZ602_10370 [Thermoguttaceae bacterium]|nr:hypothetical protein [Thermoguttaceae bacterium]MDW8036460.1 hypothetical protein [Thermoguttaceae bacterium]